MYRLDKVLPLRHSFYQTRIDLPHLCGRRIGVGEATVNPGDIGRPVLKMIFFFPIADNLLGVEAMAGLGYRQLPCKSFPTDMFDHVSVWLLDGTSHSLYHVTDEIEVVVCYLLLGKINVAHGLSFIS